MKKGTTKNLVIVLAVAALVFGAFSYGKALGDEGDELSDVFVQATAEDKAIDAEIASEDATVRTVTVTKDGFTPQTVTVKVGQKVSWVNLSGDDVIPVYTPFALEESIGVEGDTAEDSDDWQIGFTKAGTYEYHDGLHPERKGTVIVE